MQKRDEDLIHEFCNEVGVDRSVLKVWMHNNKNTLAKKDNVNITSNDDLTNNINDNDANGGAKGFEDHNTNIGGGGAEDRAEDPSRNHFGGVNVGANGSSSTSWSMRGEE